MQPSELLSYPIQSINIASTEFDASYQFPLHVQTSHQLYAVLQGAVRIEVEGRTVILNAGEALWMAPELERHPRAASATGRRLIVSFRSPWPELGSGTGEKIRLSGAQLAEARRCATLAEASRPEQAAAFHALCYSLLGPGWFARAAQGEPPEQPNDEGLRIVHQLEEVMVANVGHPLGICDMATLVHASRATLGRLFQKHRGTSVAAQFRKIRLERGRHLLMTTSYSITEIAFATGFSSSQHFATVFRKHFGKSPSDLR